ncbi:hypothetical protein LNP74_08115 [Klebsiella pneumoniae subsp. pneumoniae]|nr:hypothetical protein [Klebsiella pneumoniae subsp. pneumoniae]
MHTDDWETLSAQLANHMANVRRVFNELIGDDEAQSPDEQLAEYWRELWQDALEEDDASPALAHLNDADRRSVLALIADFRKRAGSAHHRPARPPGAGSADAASAERNLLARRCAAASGADHAAVDRHRHPHHLS